MNPTDCAGQTFTGKIKSYSGLKGYGFIVSESLNGDLFFVHKNLQRDIMNRAQNGLRLDDKDVSFTCELTAEGKPGAAEVYLLEELGPPGPEEVAGAKGGKGHDKGKGKGKGYGDWYGGYGGGWDAYGWGMESYGKGGYGKGGPMGGKGGYGMKGMKGGSKGSKGGSKGSKGAKGGKNRSGTPLISERVQGKMKSYSNGSRWGFATCDAAVGDFGDIFVHMNNMDESVNIDEVALREGDEIEMNLEELNGKPVGKNVTIVAQDANKYVSQYLKGKVKSFNEGQGYGFITSPRIWGDVWFSKDECAPSMAGCEVSASVMFRLILGPEGKPKAKMVNPLWEMEHWEGKERARTVIESLQTDGYIDDTAVKALGETDSTEFLTILPDLDLVKAENPSSFILGALSRQRKGEKGVSGSGWDMGYGDDWYGYGKGKGKGKGKGYSPY
eukprot:GEMP01026839.1.p1 GENE.GEMP01026839.1~~GEMP01026839.1.p1  ORF type:complete len:442 (+),score=121.07 GEMP01026839.1:66-1391(+)